MVDDGVVDSVDDDVDDDVDDEASVFDLKHGFCCGGWVMDAEVVSLL